MLFKRYASLATLAAMLVSLFPATALADETADTLPDLTVDDISVEDDNVLTVKIKNESDVAVGTNDFHVYIYIDDTNNAALTYNVSTLSDQGVVDANGSSTLQPQTLSEGSHAVKVCVDPNSAITEADEGNNCSEETLTVSSVEGEDGDDEDVDDGDLPDGFEEEWSKFPGKNTYYLSVQWGDFNLENDEEVMDAGTTTTWDGDISFEGDMRGKPQKLLGFEEAEDQINWDETDPKDTSFDSTIHWGHDGILFKVKADLEGDETPTLLFETDYSTTDVSVTLDEILDTVESGKAWTYSFDGDDDQVNDLVINAYKVSDWAQRLHDHLLLQTRIGNLDGNGSSIDDPHYYTVELDVSDESVIKKYRGFILEDHEDVDGYDTVSEDTSDNSVKLSSGIYGYQDGLMTLIALQDAGAENRSVTVTVTDDESGTVVFEQEFTQDVEFGVFDLEDGSGNQIEIKNWLRNKDMGEDEANDFFDEIFSKLEDLDEEADDGADVEDVIDNIQGETLVMSDVTAGAWFEGPVQWAADAGIVTGYKDSKGNPTGKFGPGDNITRFQLLKIAYEFSDLSCDPETVSLTSEVDWVKDSRASTGYDWAAGYVQCTYNEGKDLTILESENLLEARKPAYRWEVIVTLGEIFGWELEDHETFTLSDVEGNVSAEFESWTETLVQQGVITGFPDGTFGYDRFVNRAEIVKIFYMLSLT